MGLTEDPRVRFTLHPRCARGLHWTVRTDPPLHAESLADALQAALGPTARGQEQWGSRTVIRLIQMFVVELRIGQRDGELAMIHRQMASRAQREQTRATVSRVLVEQLDAVG